MTDQDTDKLRKLSTDAMAELHGEDSDELVAAVQVVNAIGPLLEGYEQGWEYAEHLKFEVSKLTAEVRRLTGTLDESRMLAARLGSERDAYHTRIDKALGILGELSEVLDPRIKKASAALTGES